ncbi:MAG: hypothetical protein ACKN9V_00100 [Pseudomonadota bacterium]
MMRFLFFLSTLICLLSHQPLFARPQQSPLDFTPSDHGRVPGTEKSRPEEAPQFSALRDYLNQEVEKVPARAEKWAKQVLKAIETNDPEKVKSAIEDLLIEDQMFLDADDERQAFGKPLKEFSAAERKELVLKFTQAQKEIREKLLEEVANQVQKNPAAKEVGAALKDIKKDHLEAYDRVIKEIKSGTIETATTHCFTCGQDEPIGSEGYTFGGAMREAANRVSARFFEKSPQTPKPQLQQSQPQQPLEQFSHPQPQQRPQPQSRPAPQNPPSAPQRSQEEIKTREIMARPVMTGMRADGGGRQRAFQNYLATLNADPNLSEQTLKRFLKSGPYAANNANYRAKIDSLNREQLLQAVGIFLDGQGPYNHCPSCNLGAGNRLNSIK